MRRSGGSATAKISPMLKRAVLVSEDAAFWQHDGVDYEEIRPRSRPTGRAAFVRGASTITQQLAKNLYLSPSRNPVRKITELLITRRLEAELPKARIFELYLNVIEWGDGIWGAEAAARAYFGAAGAALSARAGRAARRRDHQPARLQPRASERAAAAAAADHSRADGGRDAARRRRRCRAHGSAVVHQAIFADRIQNSRLTPTNRERQYDESKRSMRTAPPCRARGRTHRPDRPSTMPTCEAPGRSSRRRSGRPPGRRARHVDARRGTARRPCAAARRGALEHVPHEPAAVEAAPDRRRRAGSACLGDERGLQDRAARRRGRPARTGAAATVRAPGNAGIDAVATGARESGRGRSESCRLDAHAVATARAATATLIGAARDDSAIVDHDRRLRPIRAAMTERSPKAT